jgi:hypothetical protein
MVYGTGIAWLGLATLIQLQEALHGEPTPATA